MWPLEGSIVYLVCKKKHETKNKRVPKGGAAKIKLTSCLANTSIKDSGVNLGKVSTFAPFTMMLSVVMVNP